jgi:hypothetical protein
MAGRSINWKSLRKERATKRYKEARQRTGCPPLSYCVVGFKHYALAVVCELQVKLVPQKTRFVALLQRILGSSHIPRSDLVPIHPELFAEIL